MTLQKLGTLLIRPPQKAGQLQHFVYASLDVDAIVCFVVVIFMQLSTVTLYCTSYYLLLGIFEVHRRYFCCRTMSLDT